MSPNASLVASGIIRQNSRMSSQLPLAVDRDTAPGATAGPSGSGMPGSVGQANEVDHLRAENARLRDMLQRLAAADVSPELVAAAQVCIAPVRHGEPMLAASCHP